MLRKLFAFVEEPWDPGVLQFYAAGETPYAFSRRPITPRSVGRWKAALDREAKDAIKDTAGDLLIHLGYANNLDW